jgi:hypothetical protein
MWNAFLARLLRLRDMVAAHGGGMIDKHFELVVISALAQGSDRIVAEVGLAAAPRSRHSAPQRGACAQAWLPVLCCGSIFSAVRESAAII